MGGISVMNARQTAAEALFALFSGDGYSNLVLENALKKAELSAQDASFASALFYGVVERKITIDHIIESASGRRIDKIDGCCIELLRIGVCQLLYMDKVPPSAAVNESVKLVKKTKKPFLSGFVNAVLRKIEREKGSFLPTPDRLDLYYSCNAETVNGLIADYGRENAEEFLKSTLVPAKTYLRVNTLKTDDITFAAELEKLGIGSCKTAEHCFSVKGTGDITATDLYKNGMFHVQSRASQLCAEALGAKKGERILDACAAPGGKTFTAAQMMQDSGEIISCDLHPHRVKLIENGAARLGLVCIKPTLCDASAIPDDFGKFDRILCDVPCSGIGMLSEKPDIKYKAPGDRSELEALQRRILFSAAGHLKKGGRLVYSTCTLRKRENEDAVSDFLSSHPDFALISQKTYFPHIDSTSGFFVAVTEKR